MLVDLHTHTNASDGELTARELLALQAEAGVGLVAITDHDTLDGWERAQGLPAVQAQMLRLLPGIEFSVEAGRREVHVLGLGFDPDHPVLRQAVCRQQLRRRERAERIADRLEYLGVGGALAGAEAAAGGAGIGRPHFAHFLVASGRVRSVDEAFRRYLGRGKPAACRVEWPPLHEVLVGEDEHPSQSAHPMISAVEVPPLATAAVADLLDEDGPALVARLAALCRTGDGIASPVDRA